MSKKIVVKLDLHDNRDKQKALKAVSGLVGIDAISMDMASQKMTVLGTVDPVDVVSKLRKVWAATIDSVGPEKNDDQAKKEEGKKDGEAKKDDEGAKKGDGKKDDSKKDDEKKAPPPLTEQQMISELINQYRTYNPYMNHQYFVRSIEENPNSCAIC